MWCGILFVEFIEGMSQFSVKGDKESKLRCKYYMGSSSIYLSHITLCSNKELFNYMNLLINC